MLSLSSDGTPKLVMRDDKGKARVSILIQPDGTCALDLLDNKGASRVVFQIDDAGVVDGAILGPDGNALWKAP